MRSMHFLVLLLTGGLLAAVAIAAQASDADPYAGLWVGTVSLKAVQEVNSPRGALPTSVCDESYTLDLTGTATLTTTDLKVPVIRWPAPVAITYGTPLGDDQLRAQAVSPDDGQTVPGIFTYTPARGTVLHAGYRSLIADFAPADPATYSGNKAMAVLLVKPAPLAVTPRVATVAYGDGTPALTADTSDFVNGEDDAVLGGYLNFQCPVLPTSPPGVYAVTCSGLSSTDYDITYAPGTLTVTKALLTLRPWTSDCVGSTARQVTYTVAGEGLRNGDTLGSLRYTVAGEPVPRRLSTTVTCDLPADGDPTPGVYTTTVTANLAETDCYTIAGATGTLVVKSRPAPETRTIVWDTPLPITYGTPLSGAQLNALALDGTTPVAGGSYVYQLASGEEVGAGAVLPAGTHLLRVRFAEDTATVCVGKTVSLVVNRASLAVMATPASRRYGQANPRFIDPVVTGFVSGDTKSALRGNLTLTTTAVPDSPPTAPTGSVRYWMMPGGWFSPNYTITFKEAELSISKAPLVLTPLAAWQASTGSAPPPVSVVYAGLAPGTAPWQMQVPLSIGFPELARDLGGDDGTHAASQAHGFALRH